MFAMRKHSLPQAPGQTPAGDYLSKLKSEMTQAVRKDNLSSLAPTINRAYTNEYQPSGMFKDNSMAQVLQKLELAKQQKAKAEDHLIKH